MIETIATIDPRIRLERDGALARLTIDRPDKHNALDYPMVLALEAAAQAIERMADVRAAILTGAGDKSFCGGGDIAAWSSLSPSNFGMDWVRHGHRAFDALARLRQPLIAMLAGHALGGGLELAACADFRIAEEHARIGQPEAGLGIIPGWSGTQRAVRRFGGQIVRRMAIGGEVFTAAEALGHGLVDHVTPRGHGMAAAEALAARIAARGGKASEAVKLLINAAEGEDTDRALEALAGAYVAGTADLAEGVAAFKAKRPPKFS
jgi:enoyl-CoA hydratase